MRLLDDGSGFKIEETVGVLVTTLESESTKRGGVISIQVVIVTVVGSVAVKAGSHFVLLLVVVVLVVKDGTE